ncbi:MAG: type II secretion system protein [Rariglobus sp.]|nr:prepilin-type N-terminal cleavage/methylation domain-containing protein [Rariglobus sp.]
MSKRASASPSTAAGFTLIELLTVVAIIGILAAIIIPTVGKVRAKARLTQSTSNLRQSGQAILLYASDHRNELPGRNDGSNPNTGTHGLSAVVQDNYNATQFGRLGLYIGTYVGAEVPAGTDSVKVSTLEDPVARDATGDDSALMPVWVLNHELQGGDGHYTSIELGTVLRPFGSDSNIPAYAPMRYNDINSLVEPTTTWMMIQADKTLSGVSPLPAGSLTGAPDTPVAESYRLALFFDCSVRKISLQTNLDRPITESL